MKNGYDGALYASNVVLDCNHFVEYGPGDTEREIVELSYPGSRWTQTLRLTRMNSGFGGTRAFWMCPQCKRRVRYLYFKGRGFMCRECASLNYKSQQETKDSMCDYRRGMAFAENKLSVNPAFRPDGFDFCEYIPERPKGMHETTYRRYLSRFLKYRERHTARTMADMKKFIGPAGWMEIMRMMNEK